MQHLTGQVWFYALLPHLLIVVIDLHILRLVVLHW